MEKHKQPDNHNNGERTPLVDAFVRGVTRAAKGPFDEVEKEYGYTSPAAQLFADGVERAATAPIAEERARREGLTGRDRRAGGAALEGSVHIPVRIEGAKAEDAVHVQHFDVETKI